MGCNCGKKKGSVRVFSTEEQSRIANASNNIRVASSTQKAPSTNTGTSTKE